MSNNEKMKELYTKLSNEYSDMSFELDDSQVVCKYKNGVFVLKHVSHNKHFGVAVQYHIYYKNNIDENEVLKCLNEINSEHNLVATLTQFSSSQNDNLGCVSFAPIHIPMFRDEQEIVESGLAYFNRQKHFLTMLESEAYYEKLKELLK